MSDTHDAAEEDRLAALRSYDILDTPADGAFDRIASLAARLLRVPIAIVSLVDHDRIWFKAKHGLDVEQIDREPGLCASAIMGDEPYVVTDARTDPRSLANPLVAGDFGLRFYAAAPLKTTHGHRLGTLCVIDREPREIGPDETVMLEELAALVMEHMQLRLQARQVAVEARDLAELGKEQRGRLKEAERRLAAVLDNASVSIFVMDDRQHCSYMNAAAERLTGYTLVETQGRPLHDVIHHQHPDGSPFPLEDCPIDRAFPEHRNMSGEEVFVHKAGHFYPVAYTASPIEDEASRTIGTIIEARDISAEKAAQEALRATVADLATERQALEILNETGSRIAAELDLSRVVQLVVDAGVTLSGAKFGAFFYNVETDQGERLLLYSLSGAEISDFERFGMPRATPIFAPTFKGEGIIRSDDVTADPRYGKNAPHSGMPEGHLPVRSYLAVPVVSRSGEVIGGLFFGHPEPNIFDERAERVMSGLAGQAAIAIDNARLFQAAERAQSLLEQRVEERTQELATANEALRQAQKMEAVGQLTGGIAHDFNNMLAVILGSLELLGRRLSPEDPRLARYLGAARDGAQRAATLTQRLLAFSRQQPLAPENVNANKLVAGMSDLLRHSLGASIKLETVLAAGLWPTHVDPNQLESAILNLAVNARDAMPGGGKLTIETQCCHLDEKYVSNHIGLEAGQYVMIAVSDIGSGMPPEVIAKAFDPFFTTKEVGKGTGLGLSQVYGFVKQSGGHIAIYSEPGAGTTVKLYLPRLMAPAELSKSEGQAPDVPLGDEAEVILVVEDEEAVRRYTVEALNELGYQVIEVESATKALRILETRADIVLLFTDIVMPDVNGRELADEARRRRPHLKVLFTTGYTRNAVVHNGVLDADVNLIGKPFTIDQLAHKVRSVLESRA
ncbi:GAF domain-containing protein [Flaviflagellibacter deserti]|uniref:histidine kinase n=1 Tax=Flaviflagellibacter deserti TaxID=2267266 RepID=A0ABV9YWW5_9HYPH